MTPSPDANERRSLILDASAAINLLATGHTADILRALNTRFLLEDITGGELIRHPRKGRTIDGELAELVACGLLERVSLSGSMFDTFIDLVGAAPPDDLDDGEAAVLTYASNTSAVAVLDERRGRRIASTQWPKMEVLCTVDLLADERVLETLGNECLQTAVIDALMLGRMRVLPHRLSWIRSIVPADRLPEFSSLPRLQRV